MSHSAKSGTKAPEHTQEEARFLKHLIDRRLPIRIKLKDNEWIDGTVEYFDASFIRVTRQNAPNLFVFKHDIKYLGGTLMSSPILDAALSIAREAGEMLTGYFTRRVAFELKGDFDLVTEADRASEKLIIERLTSQFPDHSIVAEEGGGHENHGRYRWYVDPVDGTTNFAHSYPVYNVTLACERDGEMIAGVVYDPTRDEMFAAEKGAGATLNGDRIAVSKVRTLSDSLVSTGFPSRKRHLNINIHFYHQLAMSTHGVRRGGSAAVDLAYVACGRLEAFWEFGLHPWDLAAGRLLVAEAGGQVSDMKGQPHRLDSPHLLVDNGNIHEQTLALFAEIFKGEYRFPMPVINPV